MSRISGGDTKPEIVVRKLIHGMGFRFRLHVKNLPGKPDIVLARHRKIVVVNGCFWHGHQGCVRSKRPATNVDFWNTKIEGNIERDKLNKATLEEAGWQVLVVWSCETKKPEQLIDKLKRFLLPEP
ncbi:very short patch repair endonuclease [Trichlorobacter ammonificans]|uniref:very short patch repair endonuclease n=1 Tax=Trichlorobacter ammonificans TaxID=2916410 RepID=UPI002737A7DE|nr:very short patch repair endonuclease [Trichlorobacter ammonificans]